MILFSTTENALGLDGDFAPLHGRHDGVVSRRIGLQKAGDVQHYERQDHDGQAPLEPALVSAHPVEHRHGFGSLFRGE